MQSRIHHHGLEVIERVQQRDRDCEAVLVTAYANLESVIAAIDLRAVDYLTKPLPDISILPAAVDRAIGRRRRRLLARRMLSDLREAVHARADDSDLSMIAQVRDNIESFRRRLKSKRVVLIAEQEAAGLREVCDRLDDHGFGLVTTPTPAEALELCALGKINVIIVGSTFGRRAGRDFFSDLLEIANRPELIFLGPATSYEIAVAALRRGGAGYLIKPVVDSELALHITERACREQHERLYHYEVVAELHRVLGSLVDREVELAASEAIEPLLGEFDVETARQAVALFGLTEEAGDWTRPRAVIAGGGAMP